MELPSTNDEQIAQFQAEYQAAFNAGSQDELESAKLRWVGYSAVAHAYALAAPQPLPDRPLQQLCTQHIPLIKPWIHACMACRFIWALVHNTSRTNQQRGLDLAAAALENDQQTPDQDRELRYYLSGVFVGGWGQQGPGSSRSGMLDPRLLHLHQPASVWPTPPSPPTMQGTEECCM